MLDRLEDVLPAEPMLVDIALVVYISKSAIALRRRVANDCIELTGFNGASMEILCLYNMQSESVQKTLTLVMMTISSLGRLCFLMAFPRMISDSPFEYT